MIKVYRNHQTGAAIIVTMVALFAAMSLLVLTNVKHVSSQAKLIRNQTAYEETYEAAEAGLEMGIAYLYKHSDAIFSGLSNDASAYTTEEISKVAIGSNNSYSVQFSKPSDDSADIIQIASTASNTVEGTEITVTQLMQKKNSPFLSLSASLITKGNAALSGNVTISNSYQGYTILSGGTISLSGSASTSGLDGTQSNKKGLDADVQQDLTAFANSTDEEFFELITGQTQAKLLAKSDLVLTNIVSTSYSSILNSTTAEQIWINQLSGQASLTGNSTIGSKDKPKILVIDGDLKIAGNIEFYGVVYVLRDFINKGSGNLTIHGSMIVSGDMSSQGNPNIEYDADLLMKLGEANQFQKIPGGWSDMS